MSNTHKTATPDIAALLGEKRRPEKTVPICLRGHLRPEWERLKAAFEAAPDDDHEAMMHERAAKRRLADQMATIEEEMRAGTVEFRIRALPRRRTPGMPADQVVWHELVERHPPRRDASGKVDPRDAQAGINMKSLLEELVPASVVEPELTAEQWQQLDETLSSGQWEQLALTAFSLNRTEVDIPFSFAASTIRTSDAESKRPNDSASPSSGSKAGSRSRSRSTSMTKTDA